MVLLLESCVTLGKLLKLCMPQFPHPNMEMSIIPTFVKHLEQYLAQVNVYVLGQGLMS